MVPKILQYAMSRVTVHQSAAFNCVRGEYHHVMYCIQAVVSVSSYSHMLPCYILSLAYLHIYTSFTNQYIWYLNSAALM